MKKLWDYQIVVKVLGHGFQHQRFSETKLIQAAKDIKIEFSHTIDLQHLEALELYKADGRFQAEASREHIEIQMIHHIRHHSVKCYEGFSGVLRSSEAAYAIYFYRVTKAILKKYPTLKSREKSIIKIKSHKSFKDDTLLMKLVREAGVV